ncbi:phospholipase [Streptomyces xanthophaeus]|uniref:phospholipase n=1 Tax=Streptomyces xanthophaeus TaxID=67385 RepID=UPI00056548FD|nr:phospholipase [Streptomyces xanthophaeus]
MRRRTGSVLTSAAAAALLLMSAATAQAAVPADKPQVLSRWTQSDSASYQAWAEARGNREAWSAYGFDWSTDYCTASPDEPLGFPFRTACARHDFGYRNYQAAGQFPAAKARLDDAFHADMRRVCAQYAGARRGTCESTAWTYYQAVRIFGVPGHATAAPEPAPESVPAPESAPAARP